MKFTAYDVDNDITPNYNCASKYSGGWWYFDGHVYIFILSFYYYYFTFSMHI